MCVDIDFVLSHVKMFCGCLRHYDRVLPGTVIFWHLYMLFSCVPDCNSLMQISMLAEQADRVRLDILTSLLFLSLLSASLVCFSSPV